MRDLMMERSNDDIDLVVEGDGMLYADKLAEVLTDSLAFGC